MVSSKWFWTLLVAVGLLFLGGYIYHRYEMQGYENRERQLRGDLTEAEKKLLEPNAELGRLRAQLVKQGALFDEYKKNASKELEKERKDHKLEVDSLTHIIAILKGGTHGGTTVVTPHTPDNITFEWWDPLKRFHLYAGNIFDPKSIQFTYCQRFSMDMVVLRQTSQDGMLRVQHATLNEIDDNGNVIQRMELDLSKSSFKFAPAPNVEPVRPASRFLLGITSSAEPTLAWEPFRFFKDSVGTSIAVFGNSDAQYIGAGVNYYPNIKWFKSNVGGGLLLGYGTDHKGVVRAQIVVSFAEITRKSK